MGTVGIPLGAGGVVVIVVIPVIVLSILVVW